jgi:hypothetical protein
MKLWAVFLLASVIMLLYGLSGAETINKGASEIKISGGDKGDISFPHHKHQEVLQDCKICHSIFPQKIGVIKEMKENGSLQEKQVMDGLCRKCHRERKEAGKESGPITCSECHGK